MHRIGHRLAGETQDESQSVIGDFVDAVVRDIAHWNAAFTGSFQVDIVHPDAVTYYDTGFLHPPDDPGIHRGELGDDGISVRTQRDQLLAAAALAAHQFGAGLVGCLFFNPQVGEGPIGYGNVWS